MLKIGCAVRLESPLGIIADYRNRDKKHCINYCYTAQLVGEKGELKLTEDEAKNGLHVKWVPLDEALATLESEIGQVRRGEVQFYNTAYNIVRDHAFLLAVRGQTGTKQRLMVERRS